MADEPESVPPGALGDVLQDALRRLVHDSRDRLLRAADDGRARLRAIQLQRDREAMWSRLGKTAYRLVEAGELDHPALAKAIGRIDAIDAELEHLRAITGELPPADPPDEE
ncbi:MAG: hypothetical protein H6732_08640 [Alphaproteobacteria bacterium]|nr:hypothetical protein [Alphaproteobacteria bacterium]